MSVLIAVCSFNQVFVLPHLLTYTGQGKMQESAPRGIGRMIFRAQQAVLEGSTHVPTGDLDRTLALRISSPRGEEVVGKVSPPPPPPPPTLTLPPPPRET